MSDSLLLIARVEDCRTIARAGVVALPVARARIVNLEEKFENLTVAEFAGIKNDLDRFGMTTVIAVRRMAHIAARVADPSRHDAVVAAKKILHAPKAAAGQNRSLLAHLISST